MSITQEPVRTELDVELLVDASLVDASLVDASLASDRIDSDRGTSVSVHSDQIDLTDPILGAERQGDDPPADRVIRARPTFTITDAATVCAVSRKTITRKLGDLAEHGAAKDDDGIWRIPVEALLAVGLHPGRSMSPTSRPNPADQGPHEAPGRTPDRIAVPVAGVGEMVTVPRDRWDDLRIRLARAEAEAAERALALADARLALRALTAGPAVSASGPAPSTVEPARDGTGVDQGYLPVAPRQVDPERPLVAAAVSHLADAPSPVGVASPPEQRHASSAGAVPAGSPDPAGELASARIRAAQSGGYVPATGAANSKRRRWWQTK